MKIALTTNTKEIEIERNGEVVGSVYFDVTDTSIISRLRKASEELNKQYESIKDKMDASDSPELVYQELENIDQMIRDTIDNAFQYKCSDIIFGEGFSFNSHNGVTLAEQFIRGAIKYIEEETTKEAELSAKRQAKYTQKYRK